MMRLRSQSSSYGSTAQEVTRKTLSSAAISMMRLRSQSSSYGSTAQEVTRKTLSSAAISMMRHRSETKHAPKAITRSCHVSIIQQMLPRELGFQDQADEVKLEIEQRSVRNWYVSSGNFG